MRHPERYGFAQMQMAPAQIPTHLGEINTADSEFTPSRQGQRPAVGRTVVREFWCVCCTLRVHEVIMRFGAAAAGCLAEDAV